LYSNSENSQIQVELDPKNTRWNPEIYNNKYINYNSFINDCHFPIKFDILDTIIGIEKVYLFYNKIDLLLHRLIGCNLKRIFFLLVQI